MDILGEFSKAMAPYMNGFIGVLIGALVTGIYAHWNNTRIKKIEYELAYKKQILSKTIAVYDGFEDILGRIMQADIDDTGNKSLVFLESYDTLIKMLYELQEITHKMSWLRTRSTKEKLNRLGELLMHLNRRAMNIPPNKRWEELVNEESEDIYSACSDAFISLQNDYFELHHIKLEKEDCWLKKRIKSIFQKKTNSRSLR